MKKLLIFLSCTLAIVIISDLVFGVCFTNYVKTHDLPGRFQPLDKLIRQTDAEILLIGNSVIKDAIDPSIVEDSVGLSCYNGGIDGQNLEFFETIIDCVLQRHIPKMIVLGFRPEEVGENVGNGIFDVLRPYYHTGYKNIDQHFDNMSPDNRLLFKSSFYRYNTVWVRILLYSFLDDTKYTTNGFTGSDVPAQIPSIRIIDHVDKPSERKINCLKRILGKCKENGVKVCVCFPPCLIEFSPKIIPCIAAVEELCRQQDVLCLNNYNDSFFLSSPKLFHDINHININGAEIYSRQFALRIKKEF